MTDQSGAIRDLAPSARRKFATRVLPFLIGAALLLVFPLTEPSRTVYSLVNAIGINVVFALSYNMLLGQSGLLSFGHAVYFGLGGYAAMHVMGWVEEAGYDGGVWAGFPVFALPVVGFAGGAAAGAVLGWPSCRRAGVPFAMISLGVAELIAAMGYMFISVFGGEEGISGDRMNGPELFGLSLGPVGDVYWFVAFWTFLAALGMFAFTRTPLGKLAQATRDNPQRVGFIGYDAQKVRYMTFVLSGGFAGLAGGMAAVNFEIFTPESLSLGPSGMVLLMAYIGGVRQFYGPILGAAALTWAQSNLSDFSEGWLLYLGLAFIAVVLFAPGGLAGLAQDFWRACAAPDRGARLARIGVGAAAAALGFVGVVVVIEAALHRDGGGAFTLLGVGFSAHHGATWALGVGLLAAGGAVLRRLAGRAAT